MTSAELLEGADRCARIPYLSRSWQRNTLTPMGALYRSIEAGLESPDPDPGQCAGDTLMGLAVAVADIAYPLYFYVIPTRADPLMQVLI